MRVKRTVGVLAGALALAMGAGACGGAGEGADEGESGGGGGSAEIRQVPGFDGQTIRLGVLTPLSGEVAVIGEPLTAGNEVYFERVNANGGIAGRYQVELEQADTQYAPDRTVQQYNRLKRNVVAFTQVLGTAPTLATLPVLERDDAIAAPASLDAFWVRERNLLPVGGPYQVQAINALDYYVNNVEGGRDDVLCSMIQDDVYGEAGQGGLEFAAQRLNVEIAETQRYRAGARDVTGQIQQLAGANCDMVFLVGVPGDAGRIWGTAAQANFAPQWIGQSPSWIDELAQSELAPYLRENVWIVAEGTEWGDREVPGMAQMVDDLERYRPNQEPDYYFAFGYNQGRAMEALLTKAVELGDLSKEGLLRAADQLGKVSFGGLTGDYTYGPAAERNPPRTSTLFRVQPNKPFGLGTLEYQYGSDIANEFQFEEADI
jgi:ABC-type branched-subunit amino acid transport system substrate-binding protein